MSYNLTVAFIYNYQNFCKIFYTTIAIIFALLFVFIFCHESFIYIWNPATFNFDHDNRHLCLQMKKYD